MTGKLAGLIACALSIMLLSIPVSANGSSTTGIENSSVIDEYVSREMKAGAIPGVSVGIVEGNETTYLKGYGVADSKGTPVTPQTVFTICSVGKVITALAIRQLVNEGSIDYDAPVQKYIPWFTLADAGAAAAITIRDLINHSSGISTATGVEAYTYNQKYTIEQVVRKLGSVKPDRPVGQSFEYSNMNFIILGLVIEKVTGQTYEQYIRQNILDKLGMKNSFLSQEAVKGAPLAMGHCVAFGVTIPANIPFPTAQVPAGFQLTSAEDMARFVSLYISNGYVNGASVIPKNELSELNPPYEAFSTSDKRYNEYWIIDQGNPQGDGGYYGHVGGSSCFSTVMLINPVLKKAIVVLANCQNGSITAQTIGNGIAAILSSGKMPVRIQPGRASSPASALIAIILIFLLVIRFVWIRRFRLNLNRGGSRRSFALISFLLLDVAFPLAILIGMPMGFDMTWRFYFAANMELAIVLLLAAASFGAVGVAKGIVLIRRVSVKAINND